MFTEIVLFDLPPDEPRCQALARVRNNPLMWRSAPGLLHIQLLIDDAAGCAGGAYLWPDSAAAARVHDDAWRAELAASFGSAPRVKVVESPAFIDAEAI